MKRIFIKTLLLLVSLATACAVALPQQRGRAPRRGAQPPAQAKPTPTPAPTPVPAQTIAETPLQPGQRARFDVTDSASSPSSTRRSTSSRPAPT